MTDLEMKEIIMDKIRAGITDIQMRITVLDNPTMNEEDILETEAHQTTITETEEVQITEAHQKMETVQPETTLEIHTQEITIRGITSEDNYSRNNSDNRYSATNYSRTGSESRYSTNDYSRNGSGNRYSRNTYPRSTYLLKLSKLNMLLKEIVLNGEIHLYDTQAYNNDRETFLIQSNYLSNLQTKPQKKRKIKLDSVRGQQGFESTGTYPIQTELEEWLIRVRPNMI